MAMKSEKKHCERLPACPFFGGKIPVESGLAELYKKRFCLGNWNACARYIVFREAGKEFVPPDLYPNQWERALRLIRDLKSSQAR